MDTLAKKERPPRRTLRLIAVTCFLLGLVLLLLVFGCFHLYTQMQQWRDQPKTLPVESVNALVGTAGWGLALVGTLSGLLLFFAILLWRLEKKITR
jgi:hypothetical protein